MAAPGATEHVIRVMLVDDSATFMRLAARFLQQSGDMVVVGTANSAEDAIAQAPAVKPHVILLDLAMPRMSGLEAIPRLRQAVNEAGIIMLTLHDTDSYRQAALKAGADAFVCKKTVSTDLLPAIHRLARARRPGRSPEAEYARPISGAP